MRARTLFTVALVLGAVASPAGLHAAVDPPVYADASRLANLFIFDNALAGSVTGVIQADGTGFVCADLSSGDAGRFEYGCTDAILDIDPLLQSASGEVKIPSRVYSHYGKSRPRRSVITVKLELAGKGVVSPSAGQSAFTAPPFVAADAYAVAFRAAEGTATMTSEKICKGLAGCVATVSGAVESAVLADYAFVAIGSEYYDECECKDAR